MVIAVALSGFNDFVLWVTPTFCTDFLRSVKFEYFLNIFFANAPNSVLLLSPFIYAAALNASLRDKFYVNVTNIGIIYPKDLFRQNVTELVCLR